MTSLLEKKFTLDKFDRRKGAFFDQFGWEFMPFAQKDPLPDSELLVPHQKEEIQGLIDMIKEGDLVSFIVSDIGMGKTTLCRFLEDELPKESDQDIVTVFLHGPSIDDKEQMIRVILEDLELKAERGNIAMEFDQLRKWHENYPEFLLSIIIDEFPDIDKDSLEMVRSLVDLKGVVLIVNGQKNNLLDFTEKQAPALYQRKRHVLELEPMERDEVRELLIYRMAWARGGNYDNRSIEPFTEDAVDAIYKKSDGVPRKVLKLAGDAIYNAIEKDKTIVDESLVYSQERETSVEGSSRGFWSSLKFWE
ncbi:MAG: ExeA family protein [Candidatus Hadarchaeia archaeon]